MGYIVLALLAMVFLGVADILVKMAIVAGIDVNALMFFAYLVSAGFFGVACWWRGFSFKLDKLLVIYSTIVGVLIFLGILAVITALKFGNASVVVPIARMGFVITSICAFVFLRERISMGKLLGLLLAAISLVLLTQ